MVNGSHKLLNNLATMEGVECQEIETIAAAVTCFARFSILGR